MTRRMLSPWVRGLRATLAGLAAVALTLAACDTAAPSAVEAQSTVEAPVPAPSHIVRAQDSTLVVKPRVVVKRVPSPGAPEVTVAELGSGKVRAEVRLKTIKEAGRSKSDGQSVQLNQIKVAPVVFLDGVEISGAELKTLDKATIASVEVLKGAAAVAEYGERGRNGVILMKVKK